MNKKIFHTLFAPKINLPPKPKLVPVRYSIFSGGLSGIGGFNNSGPSEEDLDEQYNLGFKSHRIYYDDLMYDKIDENPDISAKELWYEMQTTPFGLPKKQRISDNLDPYDSISQRGSNVTSTMSSRALSMHSSPTSSPGFSMTIPPESLFSVANKNPKTKQEFIASRKEDMDVISNAFYEALSEDQPPNKLAKSVRTKIDQKTTNEGEQWIEHEEKRKKRGHLLPDENPPVLLSETEHFKSLKDKLTSNDKNIPKKHFKNFYNYLKDSPVLLTQQRWDSFKDLNGFFAVPDALLPEHNIGFANKVIVNINKNNKGANLQKITLSNLNTTRPIITDLLKKYHLNMDTLKDMVNNHKPIILANLTKKISNTSPKTQPILKTISIPKKSSTPDPSITQSLLIPLQVPNKPKKNKN